jgi:hypothetical protein
LPTCCATRSSILRGARVRGCVGEGLWGVGRWLSLGGGSGWGVGGITGIGMVFAPSGPAVAAAALAQRPLLLVQRVRAQAVLLQRLLLARGCLGLAAGRLLPEQDVGGVGHLGRGRVWGAG